MTQYDMAIQEIEIIKGAFYMALNCVIIYFTLLKLNKGNRGTCYAPVELSGMLCIIPEITCSALFTMPMFGLYVLFSFDADIIIISGVYLCFLWIFRKNVVNAMNKFS